MVQKHHTSSNVLMANLRGKVFIYELHIQIMFLLHCSQGKVLKAWQFENAIGFCLFLMPFSLCRFLHVWGRFDRRILQSLLWCMCGHCGKWCCTSRCPECQPLCQDPNCGNLWQCHRTLWSHCSNPAGKPLLFFSTWDSLLVITFRIEAKSYFSTKP